MAVWTKEHGAFGMAEVDGMDMTVIAVLLGVRLGVDDFEADQADMMRRRIEAARAGESVTWDDA